MPDHGPAGQDDGLDHLVVGGHHRQLAVAAHLGCPSSQRRCRRNRLSPDFHGQSMAYSNSACARKVLENRRAALLVCLVCPVDRCRRGVAQRSAERSMASSTTAFSRHGPQPGDPSATRPGTGPSSTSCHATDSVDTPCACRRSRASPRSRASSPTWGGKSSVRRALAATLPGQGWYLPWTPPPTPARRGAPPAA